MRNDKNIKLINATNLIDFYNVDILCAFEYDGNKYMLYSKNEKDFDGNAIIYSGRIEVKDDRQYIRNINGEEYEKIKEIIKKLMNYSGGKNDV